MEIIKNYIRNFNQIVKNHSLDIENGKCELDIENPISKKMKALFLSEEELIITNTLLGHFSIYWDYEIDDEKYDIGGEINYINPFKISLKESVAHLKDKGLSELIVIENHPYVGDGVLIGVLPKNNEIWIIDSNGNPFKIKLDLMNYFRKNIEFRGFADWQFLFCEINIKDDYFAFIKQRLIKLFKDLDEIFPDFDKRKYVNLYLAINGELSDIA